MAGRSVGSLRSGKRTHVERIVRSPSFWIVAADVLVVIGVLVVSSGGGGGAPG
jgi:hypothetical protein